MSGFGKTTILVKYMSRYNSEPNSWWDTLVTPILNLMMVTWLVGNWWLLSEEEALSMKSICLTAWHLVKGEEGLVYVTDIVTNN